MKILKFNKKNNISILLTIIRKLFKKVKKKRLIYSKFNSLLF